MRYCEWRQRTAQRAAGQKERRPWQPLEKVTIVCQKMAEGDPNNRLAENGGSGGARTRFLRHAFSPKKGSNHAYLDV